MPNLFNMGRSLLLSKTIVVLICLAIILKDVESKALQTSKSTPVQSVSFSVYHKNAKWFSWKFCGKLGDFCKPGSRKHCCSVGFTCVLQLKQLYKKIPHRLRFGKCQPVPTIPMNHREFNAVIDQIVPTVNRLTVTKDRKNMRRTQRTEQ